MKWLIGTLEELQPLAIAIADQLIADGAHITHYGPIKCPAAEEWALRIDPEHEHLLSLVELETAVDKLPECWRYQN